MPEPQMMQVTSGADRPSRRTQLEDVITRATQQGATAVRLRIPVMVYDHIQGNRQYAALRDATWNVSLPLASTSVETVEELIQTLGQCIVAIAQEGSHAVLTKLAMPTLSHLRDAHGVEAEAVGDEIEGDEQP